VWGEAWRDSLVLRLETFDAVRSPFNFMEFIMELRIDAHYSLCAGLAVPFLLERGQ
jgi:hypothetical protein